MEAQLQRIVLQQSHNFVLREMRISSQTLQGTAVSNTATPRRKSTALAIKAENSKAKVLLHQRHPCGNATKAYPVVLLELGN
ncbi:uncharacterized protein BcabD6B2_26440 [Babesia caballi]|uniref:Uncharacterized protein n=1 Tax=Babesia caballi TaxID=5871 RepID=A0AAV4LXK2_BABCB|nr:hypothetical protein BcabD6B2_26440 [Babesia caballi]